MAELGRLLSQQLMEAEAEHSHQVEEAAEAERAYRHLQARAFALCPSGTVPERDAWVKDYCADARFRRDLADGFRQAALEAVRSRRQEISLLQSVANAYKAEADFHRLGPEVDA